jgi:nitrilase
VAGSLPLLVPQGKTSERPSSRKTAGPRITNTCLVLSPEGEIHARYDKIHLFDASPGDGRTYQESRSIRAGKKVVVTETAWGNWGLSLCYDLRFPELYRRMADRDAHVLFVPSAFTAHTGKAHWDVLTRARAIENQAFVVAPAQTGTPIPGRNCHGHTRIIDPWGRILAERAAGEGVVWADLTTEALEKPRRELPALKNRRL